MVFDADYIPGPRLLKQLVAPFFDAEVGAVMGRVVPLNVGESLLTRLLDLERAGGYQVDQQARMNLRLIPQYGGTVGGVRRVALRAGGRVAHRFTGRRHRSHRASGDERVGCGVPEPFGVLRRSAGIVGNAHSANQTMGEGPQSIAGAICGGTHSQSPLIAVVASG